MKAIVNTGPGTLEWIECPMPAPGPGQVRIRTGACAICATDLEMIAGWDRTGFPAIPGHEWAGTVDAIGPGLDSRQGVATPCPPTVIGRRCVAENVLSDGGEVGFEHPGGYAEYFVTEADKVHVLPDDFPFAVAALIEPLAVCVRGMTRLRYDGAVPALVLGDGPIGLLTTALLKRAGAREITLVGGRSKRLDLGLSLGATRTMNYHDLPGDLATALRAEAARDFPVVIEATGSSAAMCAAMDLAARGGKILVLGDYRDARADFRWLDLLHRELELIGSNASAGAWPEAVRLAIAGDLCLDRLITHRFPADRFEEGIALVRSRSAEVIKVILDWPMGPIGPMGPMGRVVSVELGRGF